MTQDYVPFAQIVVALAGLCRQKATGTLFVATMANKSAQIVLEKGEIVFIFFSSKRGEEALTLMSTIQSGRYRFQEGGVIPRRMELPPTAAILARLEGAAAGVIVQEERGEAKSLPGNGLSREQRDALESCLAECIGPMAAIICEDHCSAAKPLAAVVDALAAEIPSPDQAQKFRELVSARLVQ